MIIFGIETSCDETAASVVEYSPKKGDFFIHSNIVSSQVKIHSKYGGIVPEVAARNHVVNIIPVIDEAISYKAISYKAISYKAISYKGSSLKNKPESENLKAYSLKLKARNIDAIAVTNGPGLITSLLVGVETAKALAYAWDKPLIAINHLEGHIYSAISNFQFPISKQSSKSKIKNQKFLFPVLALIVSGGHTQLVLMTNHGKYKIVGETRDDAAGEAFDKVAKLLGLGYPGGPAISAVAEKFSIFNFQFPNNNQFPISKNKIKLPRPMIESGDFDFSFSGLKTAVLYELKKDKNWKKRIPEYCHEFQQAVIDVLATKTQKAANKYNVKNIILAGGVSANKELRKRFRQVFAEKLLVPGPGLSTDNAAMIAMAGVYHYLRKNFVRIDKVMVDPNLSIN